MQNSQLPAKWLKPFAADDTNKVEIPLTSADPTRASQSAGFPPLTMQPPESGGVPPQGEDFNGAMNQVARIVWWMLGGGALPFDNTWASNAAINGYPQGARISAADLQGEWFSTTDNNLNNPDTVGTNWVPGYAYGATSLSGLTNANVTLTPAQAAKDIIRLAGTLTGNIQIIFPVWQKNWIVVNNCTGAFSVTCKTAAGSGAVVAQAGGVQEFNGDGTNLLAAAGNSAIALSVGAATTATQAARLGQAGFQHMNIYKRIAGVLNVSVDGNAFTTTGATTFTIPASGCFKGRVWVAGGGGGGCNGGLPNAGVGGGGGGYAEGVAQNQTPGTSVAITVGAFGAGGSVTGPTAGGTGGTSAVGAYFSATGGVGGIAGAGGIAGGSSNGGTGSTVGGGFTTSGGQPNTAINLGGGVAFQSNGGGSFGTPPAQAGAQIPSSGGATGIFPGGGGTGAINSNNGGNGADGLVIIEY